jgi:hypothetical protein
MSDLTPRPQCPALVTAGKVREAMEVARKLYKSGERVAAKQEADAIRETMSETTENLADLFALYIDLDAPELAEQTAIRLFRLAPDNVGVRRGMAVLNLMRWQLDKVRSHLSVLIELPGVGAEDLVAAAKIYLRFETKADAKVACQLIERSLDVDGKTSTPTRITLCEALMAAGHTDAALREAEALREGAQTPFDLSTIAQLFVRLHRPEEALATARKGAPAAQSMTDPTIKIMLAHVFTKLGSTKEAVPLLQSIDHAAISGVWLLTRFHDACFDADLWDEALTTGKRLKIACPDDVRFPQRITILSILARASKPASQPALKPRSLLSSIFGGRARK